MELLWSTILQFFTKQDTITCFTLSKKLTTNNNQGWFHLLYLTFGATSVNIASIEGYDPKLWYKRLKQNILTANEIHPIMITDNLKTYNFSLVVELLHICMTIDPHIVLWALQIAGVYYWFHQYVHEQPMPTHLFPDTIPQLSTFLKSWDTIHKITTKIQRYEKWGYDHYVSMKDIDLNERIYAHMAHIMMHTFPENMEYSVFWIKEGLRKKSSDCFAQVFVNDMLSETDLHLTWLHCYEIYQLALVQFPQHKDIILYWWTEYSEDTDEQVLYVLNQALECFQNNPLPLVFDLDLLIAKVKLEYVSKEEQIAFLKDTIKSMKPNLASEPNPNCVDLYESLITLLTDSFLDVESLSYIHQLEESGYMTDDKSPSLILFQNKCYNYIDLSQWSDLQSYVDTWHWKFTPDTAAEFHACYFYHQDEFEKVILLPIEKGQTMGTRFLARSFCELGRYEEAETTLESYDQEQTKVLLLEYILLYLAQNKIEKAKECWQRWSNVSTPEIFSWDYDKTLETVKRKWLFV